VKIIKRKREDEKEEKEETRALGLVRQKKPCGKRRLRVKAKA